MGAFSNSGIFFIGPESEWFWTALTGMVTAITFLAIYKQLRMQSSLAAREQLATIDAQWSTELMARCRLSVYEAWLDGTLNLRTPGAADTIDFWDVVGGLARGGHLDLRVLRTFVLVNVSWWWAVTGPLCLEERRKYGDPRAYEDFEWLAAKMLEGDQGAAAAWGKPPAREDVEATAAGTRGRIALLETLR